MFSSTFAASLKLPASNAFGATGLLRRVGIFQVLYRTASIYLQYLRIIDKKSDMVENQLHRSTQNRELIELLKLEKSLVYFTTALRSNEVVLEKLLKTEDVYKRQSLHRAKQI